MWERFTDRSRKVMALANQAAHWFNHEYIGTEHILLGLLKEGSGVGANVLKNLDVDLRNVRMEVEKLVKSGPDTVTMGKLPQMPGAKKVIEYAIEEARSLNHTYVGTEHLLLGMLKEGKGVAAQVLLNLGLRLDAVRNEVQYLLKGVPGITAIPAEEVRNREASSLPLPPARDSRQLPPFERLQCESILHGRDIEITPSLGFVLIPHSDEFRGIFDSVIRPAMAENGLEAKMAEDINEPGETLSQVWECIRTAQVIVADVSGCNANVIFELGLCFGLHRLPILLVRDPKELPFNLRALRYIQYEDTVTGAAALGKHLTSAISEFLAADI